MSAARLVEVARQELLYQVKRPLLWVLVGLLVLQAWGLSAGNVRISTGDSTVGGTEAHITSAFAQAQTLSVSILLLYAFFLAIAAGMIVIRDEEDGVGELLHSTLLTPSEYVWGKFSAVLVAFAGVLGVQLVAAVAFNHGLADATADFIGPLRAGNYLVPALVFGAPTIVFLAGTSFAVGEMVRRPIVVFVMPVVVLLGTLTFLIVWSPSWLDPGINRLLMLVDPSGFRWLNETWLKVDRGVEFYNSSAIPFDAGFLVSRAAFVLVGLAAVLASSRHLARTLRGTRGERVDVETAGETAAGGGRDSANLGGSRWTAPFRAVGRSLGRLVARLPGGRRRGRMAPGTPGAVTVGESGAAGGTAEAGGPLAIGVRHASLARLEMTRRPPGALRTTLIVAGAETRELLTRPGLYLFVPLIMLQATGNLVTTLAAFDAPALLTPGTMAVSMLDSLGLLICFLLLFYMVESLQRERSSGLAPVYYATPVRTGALLAGKALGTSLVAVAILGSMLALCLGILGFRYATGSSPVAPDPVPFLLTWGLVLVPTYVLWTGFVLAVYALVGNRYVTYAVGIAAILVTLWEQIAGDGLTWLTNWLGWGVVVWSDMGLFPLNAGPLVRNRLLALALAVVLLALAVRWFARRERDAQRLLFSLRPRSLAWSALKLSPFLLLPLGAAVPLWLGMQSGFQSEAREEVEKDYWRKNFATWRDAAQPGIAHVDLDVELEPERRWFRVEGSYDLVNFHAEPLDRWAVTPGHWEETSWSLDGAETEPEDSGGLMVFDRPLQPGERVRLGFEYSATVPEGMGRGAGGIGTFVLESGVVLTSFGPEWVPAVGYLEGIGVDEDNRFEPRDWPDDFHEGITPSGFGGSGPPYTTRIRVTAPAQYTVNSVGVLVDSEETDGRRTVVWESDHPVSFFNLVAGRWEVREGDGTALFYHPEHGYNVEEMGEALDAARRHYSEWFHPFPWRRLKVSEFPGLATYAQGFPTNITFSEGIGFLTRSDPRTRTAFVVTAHEAAHQWWGNLLVPGEGPGANVLSEGMSHFSTLLLVEEALGEAERIELARRIESRYAENRRADAERPLVKIDGSRAGDQTVTYDKGGWVAWMLLNHMGRDRMLAGLRELIASFSASPDHPVLQDMTAVLRPHAPDPAAFDDFVDQWFHDVVLPEYRLEDVRVERVEEADDARMERLDDTWRVTATLRNSGTGRMSVEVAAVRNPAEPGEPRAHDYRDARVTLTPGPGEAIGVEILCDFEPELVVVDPDALVLQLSREDARVELD